MGKPNGNVCIFLKSESLGTINEESHNRHQMLGNDFNRTSNLLKQNIVKSSPPSLSCCCRGSRLVPKHQKPHREKCFGPTGVPGRNEETANPNVNW